MARNNDFTVDNYQVARVDWNIKKFFELPKVNTYRARSPVFVFFNTEWHIEICPNGETNLPRIRMYLFKGTSPSSLRVACSLGLKRPNGSSFTSIERTLDYNSKEEIWGDTIYYERSNLQAAMKEIAPNGSVKVFCSIRILEERPATELEAIALAHLSSNSELDRCKREIKELKEALTLAKMEKFAAIKDTIKAQREIYDLKRRIKELEEKASASEKDTAAANHKLKFQDLNFADRTLSDHLKELFQSQYEGDTTVKVGDKKFLVHKVIMAARSSVFRAMFEADMMEKNDGVINIDDCEPDLFENFLCFLYCGQFGIVRPNNALKLCLLADKYNILQLKEACFEVMFKEMSAESVCDAVYLASLYDRKELLNAATEYFTANMEVVTCTPKWLSFLIEHPLIANELLVKMAKKM